MTRRTATIAADYFDDLYRDAAVPWRFRTSQYERDKYADTLGILSRRRYAAALEVGCSIGVFTRELAERCDRLVAMDASAVALASAREALRDASNLTLLLGAVPQHLPDDRFDLIVLSEVLYYLIKADAEETLRRCFDRLQDGGEIVLCHWLGETDYPLTGDASGDLALTLGERWGLVCDSHRRPDYRLDRLLKA